jgi:hypothetical protein
MKIAVVEQPVWLEGYVKVLAEKFLSDTMN